MDTQPSSGECWMLSAQRGGLPNQSACPPDFRVATAQHPVLAFDGSIQLSAFSGGKTFHSPSPLGVIGTGTSSRSFEMLPPTKSESSTSSSMKVWKRKLTIVSSVKKMLRER